jgi:hypothetical protein
VSGGSDVKSRHRREIASLPARLQLQGVLIPNAERGNMRYLRFLFPGDIYTGENGRRRENSYTSKIL